MAFQTQVNYNGDVNVKIIPVGIEYEHYYWFRSKIHINYGKSISVKDYIEEYNKDVPKGLNALNKAIYKGISPLMVNISLVDEEYEMTNFLTEVNFNNKNSELVLEFEDKIKLDQIIVEKILKSKEENPEFFRNLISKTKEYKDSITNIKTDDYSVGVIFNKQSYLYFYPILMLTFPMYFVGAMLNYIPYKIPYFVTRKMPDIMFHATMHFAVGSIIVMPLFYTIYFFVLKAYFGVVVALILLVGIGVLGLFSFEYFRLFVKLKRINRYKKSDSINEISGLRNELINKLESM